jgi:hypothetical protein
MKKMFKEGNQIHNLMSSSGLGTVINYGSGSDFLTSFGSGSGSGSTSQKVTVPTVPVPLVKMLRFLRFRFRFHNTAQRLVFLAVATRGTAWFFLDNSSAQEGVEQVPQVLALAIIETIWSS